MQVALPEELPRGAEIPENLDPLADGVLMRHQAEWLEDESDLKLAEKGRRTGVTFAEALDHTLIAAAKKSEGGQNCFYIGDTKDKGREFIGYVAHFARIVAGELAKVEEFLFEDQKPDGEIGQIPAFRVRFRSGCRVEALSSRPENIRGLQGTVCIDEAAFHRDVRSVLDSVNALLIWGGKIRVISTHNGILNPFNELIREAKAGRTPFSLHFIPFEKAVTNGLYKRVCLVKGRTWSAEDEAAWEHRIRASYGPRLAIMRQELDAIPAEAEGAALTRVQIEACMEGDIPIVRWSQNDDFKNLPEHVRKAAALEFCEREIAPLLAQLDPHRPHYFGEDFARSGDATVILPAVLERTLVRRVVFMVELRNIPFDQQREILFYVVDGLPRFSGGALDANGNGAYLAEKAAQRYGELRIVEVKANQAWYRINSTAYVEAFADRTVVLPRHEDVLQDHQALAYVGGVIKVPDDHRFKGSDGLDRHGDSAIAGVLMWHASTLTPLAYEYTPVSAIGADDEEGSIFDEPTGGRALW
jgi:phage FluMu gp28-like protein